MDTIIYKSWCMDKNNSKLLPYVNTPLKHLEELKLIIEDDAASGDFRRSVYTPYIPSQSNVGEEQQDDVDVDVQVTQIESQGQRIPNTTRGSSSRGPREKAKKRSVLAEERLELAKSMADVAKAIAELDWTQKVSNQVYEFDSIFDSKLLDSILDYFLENEKDAK